MRNLQQDYSSIQKGIMIKTNKDQRVSIVDHKNEMLSRLNTTQNSSSLFTILDSANRGLLSLTMNGLSLIPTPLPLHFIKV